MQPKRWFPKEGDLVAVPPKTAEIPGLRPRCIYGIIIREADSDFSGVWWNVYYAGGMEAMHIHSIRPLVDSKGQWLQQA